MNVRTRIAPSPTGENLHIGNVYAALLNFAVAKKNNGKFIVRIEDTDRTRFVSGSEDRILDSLSWLGLTPDESPRANGPFAPYRQSQRLNLYHEYAQKLLESGDAYFAYFPKEGSGQKKDYTKKENLEVSVTDATARSDAPKKIEDMPENGDWVIKLKVPKDIHISFTDLIHGEIRFNANDVTDQVLIKSDKYPTYHFAVVVDDHLMEISHIIRAEEWISSTPKHVLLFRAFGWDLPIFAHIPILRNPDKSKLSKRKNPVWVSWYREEGFLPEAILNYLVLMGWGHPQEKEIFPLSEFIEKFQLSDVKPVGPVFDIEKLKWMNGEYIRQMTDVQLIEKLTEFFKDDKEVLTILKLEASLVALAKTRLKTLKEFRELVIPIQVELSPEEKAVKQTIREEFEKIIDWNKDTILSAMKIVLQRNKVKGSLLYKIMTGYERGLPLPESLEILGKEKTLQRLS